MPVPRGYPGSDPDGQHHFSAPCGADVAQIDNVGPTETFNISFTPAFASALLPLINMVGSPPLRLASTITSQFTMFSVLTTLAWGNNFWISSPSEFFQKILKMVINGKEYVYELEGQNFHCAMDVTMHFIGGKWKTVVLWYLKNGTMRFGEIKKRIPDITEKMLSIQLKALEEDGPGAPGSICRSALAGGIFAHGIRKDLDPGPGRNCQMGENPWREQGAAGGSALIYSITISSISGVLISSKPGKCN